MINLIKRDLRAFDYLLAILVTVLSVVGVMMIHAVAGLQPRYAALPAQQQFHVITGVILMLVVAFVDYRFIARFFIPLYALCVMLLIAVLIIGPDNITNTARWIRITLPGLGSMSIQPSELAKFFLIVSLAKFVDSRENINRPLWLLLYLVLAIAPVILVGSQPSLSASIVLLAIGLIILFVGGLYFRTIIISTILALPVLIIFYFDMLRQQPLFITQILNERQWQRVQTFLYPIPGSDEFLQMERSLFAIGSGGMNGRGFMNNTTFVIHGHNDFVFAVAAEQFGFIGSIALLAVIGIVIVKCFLIAYRAEDRLGQLIAAGVAGMLLFEAFVNVGVVTGVLPNTGMPFPFMSYGGTHMWTHMAAIGLVLNVGLTRSRAKLEAEDYD
ncbi:MAG: FtsW/RodA/SpoVE family cell cycle protein [Defluviitaleaceae bacterium]|nr:FtsW/RodA/SpoVE family cell cycle protein [Defluviitaleaceae bacterium]